eukprot:scaffold125339_cov66-Phaeocystis_antarctica.AAC.5
MHQSDHLSHRQSYYHGRSAVVRAGRASATGAPVAAPFAFVGLVPPPSVVRCDMQVLFSQRNKYN